MDDNLTDQQRDLLYKEEEALNKAISRVQEKAQEKLKKGLQQMFKAGQFLS